MNNEIVKGIEILENKSPEEAYEYFDSIYQKNKRNYDALYYKTMIKFVHLKHDITEVINELELVYKYNIKARPPVAAYLAHAYDKTGNFDNAIKYAKIAVKFPNAPKVDLYHTLARNYFLKGNKFYDEVLEYTNKAIEEDENTHIELNFLKFEIYLERNLMEEYDTLMNELYLRYGNHPGLNHYKTKFLFFKSKNKEDVLAAIDDLLIDLESFPDDPNTLLNLLLLYRKAEDYLSALDIMEKMAKLNEHDELFIFEKFELLKLSNQNERLKEESLSFLTPEKQNFELAQFGYRCLAGDFSDSATTLMAVEICEKLFNLNPTDEILSELVLLYDKVYSQDEYAVKVKELLVTNPNNPVLHFLNVPLGLLVDKTYQDMEDSLNISYKQKFMRESHFTEYILAYGKDLGKYSKELNKLKTTKINKLPDNLKRVYAISLLNGVYFKPTKSNKIKKLIICNINSETEQLKKDPNFMMDPCLYSVLGRFYEIAKKNYKLAFKNYEYAYNFYKNIHDKEKCPCPATFLAHAYLKGIGTSVNSELAKDIIVAAINECKDDINGVTVLIYAYLYLIGMVEDGEKIFDLLKKDILFKRYDLQRYVMLKSVAEKLKIDIDVTNEINDCLKYDSVKSVKYYKEHKSDNIYYPFISNN